MQMGIDNERLQTQHSQILTIWDDMKRKKLIVSIITTILKWGFPQPYFFITLYIRFPKFTIKGFNSPL